MTHESPPRPPTPLRCNRRIRRGTENPPARPPGRTRHPLRLPAIPRLPWGPLSPMEVSENFAFLKQEFPHAAESGSYAERHVYGDPRASCFHARHALERLVMRVYKVDKTLSPPKITNLDGYLNETAFRDLVPEVIWQKAEYIRQAGNVAVHGKKMPKPETALDIVRELSHVFYWAGRTYLRKRAESLAGKTFDESLVPKVEPASCAGQRRGTGRSEGGAGRCRGGSQGAREGAGGIACTARGDQGGERERSPRPTTGTRTRLARLHHRSRVWNRAGWSLWTGPHDREYKVTGMLECVRAWDTPTTSCGETTASR